MSLDPRLAELMHDTVTLEAPTGKNAHAEFNYGSPASVKCYIQKSNKKAISRSGQELTSTVQVILAQPELPVDPDYRLTLPNGDRPGIIEVLGAPDENGDPYYLEIRA